MSMAPWSCSPARMERWKAIDRERARRNARDRETATEPTEALPVAAPPAAERYVRKPGVVLDRVASTAALSVLRGVKAT